MAAKLSVFLAGLNRWKVIRVAFVFASLGLGFMGHSVGIGAQEEPAQVIPRTILFEGVEREYFLWLPREFDPGQTYWLLVAAHGMGSNARTTWLPNDLRREADALDLPAIIVGPQFDHSDPVEEALPIWGGMQLLQAILGELRREYTVHPRILVTGYSLGGQFAHRLALWYPDLVRACAALASGGWTTPDGRVFIWQFGEVESPETYFLPENVESAPSLPGYFQPRIAQTIGRGAEEGSKVIPFLVMEGTLEPPRLEMAKQFVQSMRANGYDVETGWPRTPHVRGESDEESMAEWGRFPRRTVEFFLRVTGEG
jgi:pimeloyl-ACP methyl ester carboxylesterase